MRIASEVNAEIGDLLEYLFIKLQSALLSFSEYNRENT
jgi:hypothetical protein